MTDFERFAEALAKTESYDVPTAWGDPKSSEGSSIYGINGSSKVIHGSNFMACGRWQIHPAWYAEWADPAIQVGWSWDEAFRAALKRFYEKESANVTTEVDKAMIFHLGSSAWARGEWDKNYETRFKGFYGAKTEAS
ncbi:MAG TPA: hypothetical protein VND65_22225 [Candidatus Binatia bacterium]|nr:hypothetical protein [Candidatus Binatia bacterium]